MLAHTFNSRKHGVGGWYLSEKLDGMRCFWDGGISRGILKSEIPWANLSKDSRYKEEQIATGLWSRYGNVIHAPSWWLDKLPNMMLDGELYQGVGYRQDLMSTIKKIEPGPGWERVRYHVFDIPPTHVVFSDGRLSTPNFKSIFKGICDWEHGYTLDYEPNFVRFSEILKNLRTRLVGDVAIPHGQIRLPQQTDAAMDILATELERVTDSGGEGLMLRKPESHWLPRRSYELLKVKKFDDAEGIVVGGISGKGKLLGLLGALILDINGKRLELSGFTDDERTLSPTPEWAEEHPGQELPPWVEVRDFPRGSVVTFRYRGVTKDGIPQEARYWRHHA